MGFFYSFSSCVNDSAKDNKQFLAIACGIVIFIIYDLVRKTRNQKDARRAPLVRYIIPWLGSALKLGKNPDSLFKNATATLGPVFRIRAMGREITYITAPELISVVYRDSKSFQRYPIDIVVKIFGASPTLVQDPSYFEDYFKVHHQQLSSTNMHLILQRYGTFTYEILQDTLNRLGNNGRATGLSFVKLLVYDAAACAVFGKSFPSRESYGPFQAFDKGFLLLQTQIPRFLLKKSIQGREKLIKLLETYLANPHDVERSGLIDTIIHIFSRKNWPVREKAVALLCNFWPLQANTTQAIFWILSLQLQRPEGLTHLVKEIDAVRAEWLENNPSVKDETHCQWILEGSFPLLVSAIQEGLRYATASYPIRVVEKDTVLGGYLLSKGDHVICNTRLTHFDEDIHPNSSEFIPDRYIRYTRFTKGGRSVTNHTMPWGGGISICGGRHFAQGELKIFIAILLTVATIEIDPSSSERPKVNYASFGAGVVHPIGDLLVQVTKREISDNVR